ncbi:septum formation protein Maf [candidate division KSB1 bacterium]|nr:septum formation protein Maf [candidate division KSB1 bacterium]
MTDKLRLILASKSPRRAEIFRQLGLEFEILTVPINENVEITDPVEHVTVLSKRKAEAVSETVQSSLVVGADTIVYNDGKILNKPSNPDDAICMLRRLSGQTHQVYTGFTLILNNDQKRTDVVTTDVTFKALSDAEIEAYVASEEPLDKAGGYGIQGRAGLFVQSIHGCYFNVVGFPIARFYERMGELLNSENIGLFFK